jgi:hypothetical protein
VEGCARNPHKVPINVSQKFLHVQSTSVTKNSRSELIATAIKELEHISRVECTIVTYTLFLHTKIMKVPGAAINT